MSGPWKVVPDAREPRHYAIQYANVPRLRFRVWTNKEHAENFARKLNDRWAGAPSATLPQPASVV